MAEVTRMWRYGVPLVLALLTVILYLPGITWGLPAGDAPGRTTPWGADEIAPLGPLFQLQRALKGDSVGAMKYGLFHYIVLLGSYAPYMAGLRVTGGLKNPGPGYPYGFSDPSSGIQNLTLIARGMSLLMAVGTVIAAYFIAKNLWGRAAGVLAGLFVMLMYPMNYYGVMSNVDVPSLFWVSLALWVGVHVKQGGWNFKRAAWMGIFAALAIATKDQSYAVLLLVPLVLIPSHLRASAERGLRGFWNVWRAPLAGLGISAVVYAIASGAALSPMGFLRHFQFISNADVAGVPSFWYFRYDASLSGYLGLLREAGQQIMDTQGWILCAAGLTGIAYCFARDRGRLWLLATVPILFFGVILLVRHTAIRFLLPVGFVLALYAACLLSVGLASKQRALQVLTVLVILTGAGWQIWRGYDLLFVMNHDSRLSASSWLAKYAKPGDTVEYFELPSEILRARIHKLPRVPEGVLIHNAATLMLSKAPMQGQFVILQGPDDMAWHWFCPKWMEEGLRNGSLGYDLAADFQPPGRFAHDHLVLVSPHVRIYARRELMSGLGLQPISPQPAHFPRLN